MHPCCHAGVLLGPLLLWGHTVKIWSGMQRLHLAILGDGERGKHCCEPILQTRTPRFRRQSSHAVTLGERWGRRWRVDSALACAHPCLTLGSYLGLWVPQFHSLCSGALIATAPEAMWMFGEPWGIPGPGGTGLWAVIPVPCAPPQTQLGKQLLQVHVLGPEQDCGSQGPGRCSTAQFLMGNVLRCREHQAPPSENGAEG